MTKADKLRAALRDAGSEGISSADIKRIAGTPGSISGLCKTGEVVAKDTADGKRYTINPDFVPVSQRKVERQLPIKRKKSKRAKKRAHKRHTKTARAAKTIKDIAEKYVGQADRRLALDALVVGNLLAAGDNLARTLTEQVEGLDSNPALTAAIDQHKRAADIARAAGIDTPF